MKYPNHFLVVRVCSIREPSKVFYCDFYCRSFHFDRNVSGDAFILFEFFNGSSTTLPCSDFYVLCCDLVSKHVLLKHESFDVDHAFNGWVSTDTEDGLVDLYAVNIWRNQFYWFPEVSFPVELPF